MTDNVPLAGQDHPMLKANLLSQLTYTWVQALFAKGNKKVIQPADLFPVAPDDEAQSLVDELDEAWEREVQERGEQASLIRAMCRSTIWRTAPRSLAGLVQSGCKIVQTVFLGRLLRALADGDSADVLWLYASLVSLSACAIAVLHHIFFFGNWRCGLQLRIAAKGVMFRHLSKARVGNMVDTGQVVNVASTDLERFQLFGGFVHFIWIGSAEAIAAIALIGSQMGLGGTIACILCVFLLLPVQTLFMRRFSVIRSRTATVSDQRIQLTNQIFSGIKLIKMYAWEQPYAELVHKVRSHEFKLVLSASMYRAINAAVFFSSSQLVALVTFGAFFWTTDEVLTAERAFATISLISLLQLTVYNFLPLAAQGTSEAIVSSGRISKLLLQARGSSVAEKVVVRDPTLKPGAVVASDLVAKWADAGDESSEPSKPHLDNVSFSVDPGQLAIVCGSVGAGKSTLLMALLRELPATAGTAGCGGRLSYAGQQAWIMSGSVRENIVFGAEWDAERYLRTINACALAHDFKALPKGDATQLGPRGINLSGGQKARVALARAAYRIADVYLLDDPLSAVDPRVARHLFEQCICGLLGEKTRMLVTHQTQFVEGSDRVLVVSGGRIIHDDTPFALREAGVDVEGTNVNEPENGAPDAGRARSRSRAGSLASVGSHPSGGEAEADADEDVDEVLGDSLQSIAELDALRTKDDSASGGDIIADEDKHVGSVSWRTYSAWLNAAVGGPVRAVLLISLFIGTQLLYLMTSWWVSEMTDMNATDQRSKTTIWIYTGLVLGTVVAAIARATVFFAAATNASSTLHNAAFLRTIRAPMVFFDRNPLGRILNRFSKDVGFLDDMLPMTALDFGTIFLLVLGVVGIVSAFNFWVLFVAAPIGVLFVILRRYYMRTAREVKRLEAVSRSPVFSLLSETISGLATIHAFEKNMEVEFIHKLNANTQAFFAFLVTSRWLGFRLDSMSVCFLTAAVFLAVAVRSQLDAGVVGLSISYCMTLTGLFQWCVRQAAELENQMVSSERVHAYCMLDQEPASSTKADDKLPASWPETGRVEFDNVVMRYRTGLEPVLRGVSFDAKGGSKVALVGRTGAGKSSLIQALFRVVEPDADAGPVLIDGVDTRTLGLDTLRRRLAIIPQDPVLFAGSLRANLDPFGERTDADLWSALEAVQLRPAVEAMGGLDSVTAEAGNNLSTGQRQLVCLARAILRQSKVVCMDEATANVDNQTDALIQRAIRRLFVNSTVLVIAHRLLTVIDVEQVIVLEDGRVVEAGQPHVLLQKSDGAFTAMVEETGPEMAKKLRRAAKAAALVQAAAQDPAQADLASKDAQASATPSVDPGEVGLVENGEDDDTGKDAN